MKTHLEQPILAYIARARAAGYEACFFCEAVYSPYFEHKCAKVKADIMNAFLG